jgi:hypothetical protein
MNCPKPAELQSVSGEGKSEQSKLPSDLKAIPSLKEWAKEEL